MRKRPILFYLILIILVLSATVYYTWPQKEFSSEKPPTISFDPSQNQALLRVSDVFLQLEEDDKKATCNDEYDINLTDNTTPFYWFTEDTSWGDLINAINGDAGTHIFVAYYSPNEGYDYPEAGYYAYPGGSETLEMENDEDDESDNVLLIPVVDDIDDSFDIEKVIPAFRPFFIAADNNFELCDFKDKIKTVDDPSDTFNPISDYYEGWIMLQAPENQDDLETWLDDVEDRIATNSNDDKQFYYYSYDSDDCGYDSDGDGIDDKNTDECFTLGDIEAPAYSSDNYTIWIKFEQGASVS